MRPVVPSVGAPWWLVPCVPAPNVRVLVGRLETAFGRGVWIRGMVRVAAGRYGDCTAHGTAHPPYGTPTTVRHTLDGVRELPWMRCSSRGDG